MMGEEGRAILVGFGQSASLGNFLLRTTNANGTFPLMKVPYKVLLVQSASLGSSLLRAMNANGELALIKVPYKAILVMTDASFRISLSMIHTLHKDS